MINYQSGIVAEAGAFALYALLKVSGNPMAVLSALCDLHKKVEDLNDEQVGSDLSLVVSFTPSFCVQNQIPSPENAFDFIPLGNEKMHAPATDCDSLIHLHSQRHDLNFYAFRTFLNDVNADVEVIDETHGFRYLDLRDLTGFIDGTENPQDQQLREDVALVDEGEFSGGSFVLVQRYIHQLPAWEKLSIAAQERVIGRTKSDSIELSDVPEQSHVGRVDIKENGKGLKMVRHSLPYGTASGEHGLLFISYSKNQSVPQTMLESMFGVRDGHCDHLLNHTKAVTGAYFYAPPKTVFELFSEV